MHFVALCCTLSIVSMSFTECGAQPWFSYSRSSLTGALYKLKMCFRLGRCKLLFTPTTLFALLTFSVMCSRNVRRESIITPMPFSLFIGMTEMGRRNLIYIIKSQRLSNKLKSHKATQIYSVVLPTRRPTFLKKNKFLPIVFLFFRS